MYIDTRLLRQKKNMWIRVEYWNGKQIESKNFSKFCRKVNLKLKVFRSTLVRIFGSFAIPNYLNCFYQGCNNVYVMNGCTRKWIQLKIRKLVDPTSASSDDALDSRKLTALSLANRTSLKSVEFHSLCQPFSRKKENLELEVEPTFTGKSINVFLFHTLIV